MTPDPSPSGETWVCRAAKGYTRCDVLPCTVRGYPEHKRCGPVPSSDTPSDGAGCPSKDCTRGECIDCPPPTPIDGDSGRRMETLLSRFAWLADSARSEGFHEAAAAYTVCRDELSDALTPAPASPPVGGGRAPSPFETFQAGMAAGLLSDRHALIHDYTEAEVREEFRDWLEERAAAAAADRGEG